MRNIPSIYFGAADRQMECIIQPPAFARSLVLGILFQGNLVIPDIFFHISSRIREIGLDREDDLISCALREGVIIPSFRDGEGSFRKNLITIRQLGIQGVLPEAAELAHKFDRAAEASTRYAFSTWPSSSLAAGYERIIRSVLLAELTPNRSSTLDRVWARTRPLREAALNEAIEHSHRVGEGVRRGDIYNSIAKILGGPQPVDDISDILKGISDGETRRNVLHLLKWVNYCYHVNQGTHFGLDPGLSQMDEVDISFADAFASRALPDQKQAQVGRSLEATVEIPLPEQLLTVPAGELLAARNGEGGAAYFSALEVWKRAPSQATGDTLLSAIGSYAAALRKLYVTRGANAVNAFGFFQSNVSTGETSATEFAVETARQLGEHFLEALGFVSLISGRLICLYSLLPPSARRTVERALGVNHEVEFTFSPERRVLSGGDLHDTEASFSRGASLA